MMENTEKKEFLKSILDNPFYIETKLLSKAELIRLVIFLNYILEPIKSTIVIDTSRFISNMTKMPEYIFYKYPRTNEIKNNIILTGIKGATFVKGIDNNFFKFNVFISKHIELLKEFYNSKIEIEDLVEKLKNINNE